MMSCSKSSNNQPAQQPEGTPAAAAGEKFAPLGDFRLRSGATIYDFRLGYRTLGTLNAEKSNAVLWPTWLGGTSEMLLQFVGPANVVDTDKYFVVLVDAIGDGVSSSPSNSKTQPGKYFPQFSIRDMVDAEYRLATETLHLTHLHAVMGISMGGVQTFEWTMMYPDFMDLALPLAGSPQSTSYDKLLWTSQIDAIESDPAWNDGSPTGPLRRGIALSREIGSMNITSPEYRASRTKPNEFSAFIAAVRNNAAASGVAAWDQIRQRQALMNADIPGEFGITLDEAAHRVKAKMLVIVSPEDHMVNPLPAMAFAKAMGAPVITLDSPCGHDSFKCISVGPTVAAFLANPGSVHSQTMKSPPDATLEQPQRQ